MSRPIDPAPYFSLHVFVCTNRRPDGGPRGSCAGHGSESLRDYLKAKAKAAGLADVRINSAGCLDRCALGPVLVVYPDGIWYGVKTHADIDDILETHLVGGGRVERLMLTPDQGK